MEGAVLPGFVPISANMISTDLFTPSQKERATMPTIGLPKPFDTPLDPAMKLKDAPTEGRPYTSHVFPRNDPNRNDSLGNSPLTGATRDALNEINRDLYQTCKYQQTYQDHTNYIRSIVKERAAKQKQFATTRHDMIKEKYPKIDEARDALPNENDRDDKETVDPNEKGPTLKSILIKKHFCPIHDATPPKDGTPKPEKAGVTPCWPPSLSYKIDLKTAKLNGINLPKFPPALRSAYSPECCCNLIKTSKSVSFANINITDTPMPTKRTKRPPTPFKDQQSNDADKTEPAKENSGKLFKGKCFVSSDMKEKDEYLNNTCLNTSTGKLQTQAMIDHIRPSLKAMQTTRTQLKELNGVQLPVPIDYLMSMTVEDQPGSNVSSESCRNPKPRERIVDKLGVRFKSAAHKRFHATHPDPLKDLRDAREDGKQYFFFGFHASAFRG